MELYEPREEDYELEYEDRELVSTYEKKLKIIEDMDYKEISQKHINELGEIP